MALLHQKNVDPQNESNGNGVSKHALLVGNICLLSAFNNDWMVDSGSTDHICPHIEQFQSYETFKDNNCYIIVPDGRKVKVLHIGTVKINDDIILQRVLHVPDFHFRLIFVVKLCEDLKCQVVFTNKQCYVQGLSQNRPQILLGNISNGLYSLKDSLQDSSLDKTRFCNASYLSTTKSVKVWHLRMGHISFHQMKLITPFNIPQSCLDSTVCQICPAAKQVRKSFSSNYIKSTSCFQLLHIDIWGPYQTKSISGCTMFLIIVDDYSRFTWIHLLKYKFEVSVILENFLDYLNVQFDATVKCIRSDNALELSEGLTKPLYLKRGIIHQTSCAYTPQQKCCCGEKA